MFNNFRKLNDKKQQLIPYENIYNGNIKKQISVYKKVSENLKTREKQCLPFGLSDQLFVTVRDKKEKIKKPLAEEKHNYQI